MRDRGAGRPARERERVHRLVRCAARNVNRRIESRHGAGAHRSNRIAFDPCPVAPAAAAQKIGFQPDEETAMRRQANARTSTARRTPRPLETVSTRIVTDRRWIHRNQLEIGMYVQELDRPWTETRFMFQGFRIETEAELEAVREACEYACIDTEKLAMVSSHSTHRLVGATRRH